MDELKTKVDRLINDKSALEKRIEETGGSKAYKALDICRRIRELIGNMETLDGRTEDVEKGDIATKIKFSRKVKKVGREFWRIVNEINGLYEKKELQESHSKILGKAMEHIKVKKFREAKSVLGELKELETLFSEMARIDDQLNEIEKVIDTKIDSLKDSIYELKEIRSIDDLEKKKKRYDEITSLLNVYSSWREEQISKLKKTPALKLVSVSSSDPGLFELGFPKPKDMLSFDEFEDFLKISGLKEQPEEILEMADMEMKLLKRKVKDQHLFRRLVSENIDWLRSVSELENSEFLVFDMGNEKRKNKIMDAVRASKNSEVEKKVSKVCEVPHEEYEDLERAALSYEKKKKLEGTYTDFNAEKMSVELEKIMGIKTRLDKNKRKK